MKKRSTQSTRFAVCVNNEGYPASLELGKLYRVLPDEDAATHGYLRVVDESGEDYGYSAERFFLLDVPLALQKALSAGSATTPRQPNNAMHPTPVRALTRPARVPSARKERSHRRG